MKGEKEKVYRVGRKKGRKHLKKNKKRYNKSVIIEKSVTEKSCAGECGECSLDDCEFAEQKCKDYENLRCLCPNEPEKLGSSTHCQATEYKGFPMQSGSSWSTGLKLEYNTGTNKYSLPGLCPTGTFDLVPSSEEAGDMDSEIIDAGYVGPFASRTANISWYGLTIDEENFYYSVWGGSLFGSIFGFGTSSLFVCRKRSGGSLVWVKNCHNYSLETPGQPNFVGSSQRLARVVLAISGDRLYTTSMVANIGPELFCIDKATGNPIWTMAYQLPVGHPSAPGVLQGPADVAINSQDATAYAGQQVGMGDLHLSVVELAPGKTSIFVGLSSFQNAINPSPTWPTFTDKGHMYRIDDLGTSASLVWSTSTCAPDLLVGDTITAGDANPDLDPFRPGKTEVIIWRDTTSAGTFSDAGGVVGKVLDNTGPNPGYRPIGYTGPGTANNDRMPASYSKSVVSGDLPLVEADFPSTFRTPAPGIGSGARIYQFYPGAPSGAKTITNVLIDMNAILPGILAAAPSVRVNIWAYLTAGEVVAINGAGAPFLAANVGVRYVACLPDGYTIANEQEVMALGYYGNSVWGQSPVIDEKRGYAYFGTGQAHAIPLDEELFYQDPAYDFRKRAQPVVDRKYEYTQDDVSLGMGPYATLTDINDAKKTFVDDILTDSLDFTLKSPRGNRSYSTAMMGCDLETGDIAFGFRTVHADIANFTAEPLIIREVPIIGIDADVSSGIHYFDNVLMEGGDYGTFLASANKGGLLNHLDISGLNRNVPFDHTNLMEKGVIPTLYYGGTLSALGGSNFGSSQSGGRFLIYQMHNKSTDVGGSGVQSETYQDNFSQGWEFHVTRDGRVLPILNSVVGAFDVGKKKIVWEFNIGQESASIATTYNGVVYVGNADGTFYGLDVENGEQIWAMDGSVYGLSGLGTPVFSDGCAILIANYNFAGGGSPGNTGVFLKVNKGTLLTPDQSLEDVVCDRQFTSFDVTPKKPGATVFDSPLIMPEIITHVWSGTSLTATHNVESGPTEILTIDGECLFYQNQTVTFKKNTYTSADIRYTSMRFVNCGIYFLYYQRLESGVWVNYEATLKVSD